jgi:hypothetical protein
MLSLQEGLQGILQGLAHTVTSISHPGPVSGDLCYVNPCLIYTYGLKRRRRSRTVQYIDHSSIAFQDSRTPVSYVRHRRSVKTKNKLKLVMQCVCNAFRHLYPVYKRDILHEGNNIESCKFLSSYKVLPISHFFSTLCLLSANMPALRDVSISFYLLTFLVSISLQHFPSSKTHSSQVASVSSAVCFSLWQLE